MPRISTPFRVAASAALLAVGALTLTACSPTVGGSGLTLADAKDKLELPAGIPVDASDLAFLQEGAKISVSWKGGPVVDDSCTANGSPVPTLPESVTLGATVTGDVERCDFGHQVTSGDHTYLWMQQ